MGSFRLTSAVLLYSLLSGCGEIPVIELGRAVPLMEGAPEITQIRFLGQSALSSEVLVFEIDFTAGDHDLGSGFLDIFINGKKSSDEGQALKTIFLQSQVDPRAQTGTLRFSVKVFFPETDWDAAGANFEISLCLRDDAGRTSNHPRIRFIAEIFNQG